MATALGNNTTPAKRTSPRFWIKEVTSTGADLGTPDTFVLQPARTKATFSFEPATGTNNEVTDESGNTYILGSSTTSATTKITINGFRGKTKDTWNFITDRTKYYAIVVELTDTAASGVYEYAIAPVVQITGNSSLDNSAAALDIEFTCSASGTSVTIASSALTGAAGFPTSQVVPSGTKILMAEKTA